MYLAVNLPRHITTLGGVFLLTYSCMIIQILKCTGIPPTSWCACTALISIVLLCFGNLLFPAPRYLLQYVLTWNSKELGMPRSFLLSWQKIPSLALRFTCFLDLWVTQPCKGEKENGASSTGNFCNKNKHNISPMITLLPPVSLTFSTVSEYLNSPLSADNHSLPHWHRKYLSAPPCRNQSRPSQNPAQ